MGTRLIVVQENQNKNPFPGRDDREEGGGEGESVKMKLFGERDGIAIPFVPRVALSRNSW